MKCSIIASAHALTTVEATQTSTDTYAIAVSTDSVFDTLVIGVDGDIADGVNIVPLNEQFGSRLLASTSNGFRLLSPLGATENEGVFEPGLNSDIALTYGITTPVPGEWIDGLLAAPFLEFRLQSGVALANVQFIYRGETIEAVTQVIPNTPLAGDYNSDGAVDAADYTVWRDTLGTTGLTAFTGADGNGDGNINQADYTVWQQQYGMTLGDLGTIAASSSQAIPEPSSLLLLYSGVLLSFARLSFF